MNKYFGYKNIEYWQSDKWADKVGAIDTLFAWIQTHDSIKEEPYDHEPADDPTKLPYYNRKTLSADDPAVFKYWDEKGLFFKTDSQGGKVWAAAVPKKAFADRSKKIPALVVLHQESYSDAWWGMRLQQQYRELNELAAKTGDFMVVYLVTEGLDEDRIYFNIMQEAFILYPADLNRIYLDVRKVYDSGKTIADTGYVMKDENGNALDADAMVEKFSDLQIPALNISGKWGNADSLSRGLVMEYKTNDGIFNRDWMVHSGVGERMIDGLMLEYKYGHVEDPGVAAHFAQMGLQLTVHYMNGERWLAAVPQEALEDPEKKLPVMCLMQEVYQGNEHLAVASLSYFYEYCKIAAQGECILLFFVLEDPDSNDLLVDILDEATGMYPIDRTRTYIIGHSHDGSFALRFTCRHPELITALATLGDPFGLMDPAMPGYPIMMPPQEELDALSKVDMPVIDMMGEPELRCKAPYDKDFDEWVSMWQRRLTVSHCPMKSEEEIAAAFRSENRAIAMTRVPADYGEVLWGDGIEHYVADILNTDGRKFLRVVASQNMPHTTTPFMLDLSWAFLRRFARDPETHEIIELYR